MTWVIDLHHQLLRTAATGHSPDLWKHSVQLAQLAIGVLGVLVISAEYSTGMIRASFTAVPKRLPVLWAKLGVFAAVTFALMLPAVLVAFFAGEAILARHHIEVGFTAPHVVRVLVGAALYLTVVGLFGLGLGAIVRNTAEASRRSPRSCSCCRRS